MNEPSSWGRSVSMRFCSSRCAWVDHYDAVQMCAVVLLYLQVVDPFSLTPPLKFELAELCIVIEHESYSLMKKNSSVMI